MSGMNQEKAVKGFTLLELLMAMSIFLVLCAAMFGLLRLSQQKYANETQLSGSFQEARLAMDQIVRDVNISGYPAKGLFSVTPTNSSQYTNGAVAWSPGYPNAPCQPGTAAGGTCLTPSDYDLILEARLGNDTNVSWIWYHLDGTTLYRAVAPKNGTDPVGAVSAPGLMVPFLTNVMNNPGSAMLAQITAQYPTMFPGGQPQPIFQYTCDTASGPQACPNAGGNNSTRNIRDVDVTLIVMTLQPDLQTQRLQLVELSGRGHRLN